MYELFARLRSLTVFYFLFFSLCGVFCPFFHVAFLCNLKHDILRAVSAAVCAESMLTD